MGKAVRAAVAAAVALAFASCGGDEPDSALSRGEAAAALRDARGALGDLYSQPNELLDGGASAFRARLRELRGHPVVVNKWASWCPPCRSEFPFFQRQATKRGREVAFIGVNSNDNDGDAREFLEKFPLPFPSYKDPDSAVARVFNGAISFPTTAFYDSDGKLAHVKQGGYATEAKLAEDIEQYAR